jgi:predicted Zn finger-like uncharacterized protein
MALATTCPQCKTSFKVVPDQLKLRRGLVRCGVCQHVFSGIDFLRYVDDAARAAQRAARASGEADGTADDRPLARTPDTVRTGRAVNPGEAAAGLNATAQSGTPGGVSSGLSADPSGGSGGSGGAMLGGALGGLAGGAFGTPGFVMPEPTPADTAARISPSAAVDGGAPGAPGASGMPVMPGVPVAPFSPDGDSTTASRLPGPPASGEIPAPQWPAPPGLVGTAGAPGADPGAPSPISDVPASDPAPERRTREHPLPAEVRTRRVDPWAAAAEAAHERSLRDDMPLLPGVSDPLRSRFGGRPGGDGSSSVRRSTDDTGTAANRTPTGRPSPVPPPARLDLPGRPGSGELVPFRGSAPAAPQTLINPDDDLKTAFFLTDSSFGPLSPDTETHAPERSALDGGGPATRHGSTAQPGVPLHRSGSGPDTIAQAEADWPLPLRPDAHEPTRIGSDDPLGPPTRFAPDTEMQTRRSGSGAAARLGAAAPASDGANDAAIDYFTGGRGRHRGLGLALSPAAWAVASALTLLLMLQAVVGWRDAIAARLPALEPVMEAVMAPFGLEIGPPRDLSALTIESFELQAAGLPNLLQMTAVLRNRGERAVGFPAMELSLTDSAGALVVRKVITADVYLAGASGVEDGLGARSEWPLRLALEHGGLRPTGYSVALFYP